MANDGDWVLRMVTQGRFEIGASEEKSRGGCFRQNERRISRIASPSFTLEMRIAHAHFVLLLVRGDRLRFVNTRNEEVGGKAENRRWGYRCTLIEPLFNPVE